MNSKIRVPVGLPEIVPRPRLTAALEEAVHRYRLVLLSAPAGYGKTTLLAEWARSSSVPVVWLAVTGDEGDAEAFIRYLVAAWKVVRAEVIETRLGILAASFAPDIPSLLREFINATEQEPGELAFVLDDYHLIQDPGIHEAVTFLLDHLPQNAHFILASRGEPGLPLARYRARRTLYEMDGYDLQFKEEECVELLKQIALPDLTSNEAASLLTYTEGWIAGLQLAALHLRQRGHTALQGVPLVSGRHRFISDYLAQDVLSQLPVDMQDFLLKTSILEEMCSSLCDAVLEGVGGQRMLERLERENLFLIPLDDVREWYRYHNLFSEFLRAELSQRQPGEIQTLHFRAAQWLLEHNLPDQAFDHAIQAGSVEIVIKLLNNYFGVKLFGGEVKIAERWVKSLPAEWEAAYPALGLSRAYLLAFQGAFEASLRCVDEIEQKLLDVQTDDRHWQSGWISSVRCNMACIQNDLSQAETYAQQAFQELPQDDIGFRPVIYGSLGDVYRHHGQWQKAKDYYLRVLDYPHSPVFPIYAVNVYGALADLALQQGHLHNAFEHWNKALAFIQNMSVWDNYPLPVSGWIHIRMAEIYYEWDQKEEAKDHVRGGPERAEMGGDVRALIAGCLTAGRLELSTGDIQAASTYAQRIQPLLEQASFPEWTYSFERFRLDLLLAQGKPNAAVDLANEILPARIAEGRQGDELAQLVAARALVIKGDAASLKNAIALLEQLVSAVEVQGRLGLWIESLALEALAQWKLGDLPYAMTFLEHSLRLAEPEGYVRLFADFGRPMAQLLQEARSRAVLADYTKKILSSFRGGAVFPGPAEQTVPEPLTERELEILKLVAAGLTNREIAEQLVISPETVKKHIASIFGKLGTSNRTEATARARALNLLD